MALMELSIFGSNGSFTGTEEIEEMFSDPYYVRLSQISPSPLCNPDDQDLLPPSITSPLPSVSPALVLADPCSSSSSSSVFSPSTPSLPITSIPSDKYQISSTNHCPAQDEYPGPYSFKLLFESKKSGSKWNYSSEMNKLYIKPGLPVMLGFTCETMPQQNVFIRALPVFSKNSGFYQEAVVRCHNHKCLYKKENEGFGERASHVVWCDDKEAMYEFNTNSKRYSVRVPMEKPQEGTKKVDMQFRFMCQTSCKSINYRDLELNLTLEDEVGKVLGRTSLNVKVCSGPNRDRKSDENKLKEGIRGKKRKSSSPSNEQQKVFVKGEDFVIRAVHKDIFLRTVRYALFEQRFKIEQEAREPTSEETALMKEYEAILAGDI